MPSAENTPSITSSSFLKPPVKTKWTLMLRDRLTIPEGSCWICQDDSGHLQIAHILFAYDISLFERYKTQGLLGKITHPAHIDNLQLLCPTCHSMYDLHTPRLAMLPTDLDFFIKYEEDDYKKRQEAAIAPDDPQLLPRKVPTATDYNGTYDIIYLNPKGRHVIRALISSGGKGYCYAPPTALILKAAMAIGCPTEVEHGFGFRNGMIEKVTKLIELWRRPPPRPPGVNAQGVTALQDITINNTDGVNPAFAHSHSLDVTGRGEELREVDDPGVGPSSPKKRKHGPWTLDDYGHDEEGMDVISEETDWSLDRSTSYYEDPEDEEKSSWPSTIFGPRMSTEDVLHSLHIIH